MCRLQVSMQTPRDQLDIKESDAPQENRLNNYIRSKLASEKLFKDYPDVSSVILRPRGLLELETPAFCHVFLILVRRSVFL